MALPPEARVLRKPDTVWREIEGRAVVISLENGRIRTLNAAASAVWLSLDGRPLSQIAEELGARFPGEARERLEADLQGFVADLLSRDMAQLAAASR